MTSLLPHTASACQYEALQEQLRASFAYSMIQTYMLALVPGVVQELPSTALLPWSSKNY